ncbi:MAG: hypothetical protein J7M11_02130, partial [Elusimicrobia bacterium]|nr:hypothetical protein [Elusimicrobiota bacterium]
GLPAVIKTNFIYFLKEIPAVAFFTEVLRSRMGVLEIPAALIIAVVLVKGLWVSVKKTDSGISSRPAPSMLSPEKSAYGGRSLMMALYLILYIAFHIIWPAKGARFIIPILPFIYYFFFSAVEQWGMVGLFGRFNKKVCGAGAKSAVGVAFRQGGHSVSSVAGATVTALLLAIFAYQNYLILITPPSKLFPETFDYVKKNSISEDIFVNESSERFFLKTGVKTVSPQAYLTADDFYYSLILAGVTRASFFRIAWLSTEYNEFPTSSAASIKRYAFFLKNPKRFDKEYENKDEGTAVYRLNKSFAESFKKSYDIMIKALRDIKGGRKADAEKKLKNALEICPRLTKAADNLLLIYIDSGRLKEADELIKKIEETGVASHITLFLAGELCERTGEKKMAVDYYRRSASESLKIGDYNILKAAQERLVKCQSAIDKIGETY